MPGKLKYYLTTPIYYTNGLPHIGHTYSTIVCDTIRRFKRMRGYDVVMTTGTDEHGVNVERSAKKAGVPESEFVAKMAAEWRALWDELGVQGDEFIRTTDLKHAHTVQWLFKLCRENDFVYPGHYTGQYCIYDNAYVDVKPGENCPDCGRPTETVTEPNYFFKLSAFQKPLLDWYARHPDFIQPEARRNEVLSFVEGGLRDLSITRTTVRWGIPVPGEEPHVFYVWYDALTAYLSAVGGPNYEKIGYWPADVHLVGKEILRFHAVYWPAFLMAAGLPLPKGIYAHGLMLIENDKISKSRGNLILAEPITRTVGADALRYFLLREIVFGQDGSFSYDALVTRFNSDLANGLGNLVSRTLTMITRYFEGKIPEAACEARLSDKGRQVIADWRESFEKLEFASGLERVWTLIAEADKYIVENKPWALAEQGDRARLATVLYTCAEVLRMLCPLIYPVLPVSAERIWKVLGQTGPIGLGAPIAVGQQIGAVEAIFPRLEARPTIEKMRTMEQEQLNPVKQEAAAGPIPAPAPAVAAKINIDDFLKVEMRVGTVVNAERIPKATKLLKLNVDIGTEVRQLLAGIAESYAPEDLVGKKVVIVANLAPRTMRGLESNGMIVAAAVEPDGKPTLVSVPDSVPNG